MLRKLRKRKIKKTVWVILAVIIVPAFVLWGSGSLMRNKQEGTYAGKIFGRAVTLLEYKDAADAIRNQMIMQFGDKYNEIQKSIDLEALAWDRLILLTEAKRLKISANDKEVVSSLENYPIFQNKGKFDERIYSQMLQYVFHAQPRLFEEQMRQALILSKLYNKVTEGIKPTDKDIEEEYRKLNERISVSYVAALPAEFEKTLSVNETEIKDYFDANKLEFKQPLSFNIEYVSWSADDKDAGALNNKAQTLIIKKDNFSKAAKDLGFEPKDSGFFNQTDPIPGIGWSPQIITMLSEAGTGDLLPVIQSDKNYYLVKLKEKKEPYIPDLESVKDRVKESLLKNKTAQIAKTRIEDSLKQLNASAGKADFEQIAKTFGLKNGSTQEFTFGSYIEGIGISDNFWLKASVLKDSEYSGVIEMPSGFYIIKIKARVPIDEKKFAQEKQEFAAKLLTQKKEESFSKFAEELRNKAQRF